MLENDDYSATFGNPSADPYLATTLPAQGAFLENYYGVGHFSNDNYIGFISGQPPNTDNQIDCLGSGYADFGAGQIDGIQQGLGCVYPSAVTTLADQLSGDGLTWKGYEEDMGNDPTREAATTAATRQWGRAIPPPPPRPRRLCHPPRPLRLLPLDHRQLRRVQPECGAPW